MTDGAESASASAGADEKGGLSERVESLTTPAPDEPARAPRKPKSMVAPAALALLLVAATAYAFWAYRKAGKPRPAVAGADEIEVTVLTRTGTTGRAAISPARLWVSR